MDRKFNNVLSFYFAAVSVASILSQVRGDLVVAPENRVALLGQSVQLNCSTDDRISVNWLHFPVGSTTSKDVYISRTVISPYHQRFTIQNGIITQKRSLGNNVTAFNLVVTDIRKEDAGTYRCVDRTGMGEQRDAELTVFESLPKCTTNIEPSGVIFENDCRNPIDEIHSSCSIEYAGNIAPQMQWTTTSGQDTIQPQPLTNVSEKTKTVSSELNITATKSMDGTSVIWYSTQSMQINWTSAPIKLLYARHSLSPLILSQSQNVTCSANSSQECSYTWIVKTNTDNKLQKIERQTLEVNQPGIYLCEANCPFHDTPCTVIAKHVEYRIAVECECKNSVLIAPFVIAILVAIGLVIGMWRLWVVKSRSIRKLKRELNHVSNSPPSSKNDSPPSSKNDSPPSSKNDSPPSSKNDLPPSSKNESLQVPLLINKFTSRSLRQNSNGTSSSSGIDSSQSGSDEKEPCTEVKSNGNCHYSTRPPA